MSCHLLHANVLIALMWPASEEHRKVRNWFRQLADAGWATCPFNQAAFVRMVSNPAFSSDAVTPQQAVGILETNLKHPGHQFWAADISFLRAAQPFARKLAGHEQVTHADLLGLAMHKKGKLVSLDGGPLDFLPEKNMERGRVIVL